MKDLDEKSLKMAKEIAELITKNIRDVTTALTMNIDYDKRHTIVAAFGAVYSVSQFFEYKLTTLGVTPAAIQEAKEGADKYVLDVIAGDSNNFAINKGDA